MIGLLLRSNRAHEIESATYRIHSFEIWDLAQCNVELS